MFRDNDDLTCESGSDRRWGRGEGTGEGGNVYTVNPRFFTTSTTGHHRRLRYPSRTPDVRYL